MDRQSVWGRDRSYRLRDTESHTVETVGTFHMVLDRDLRERRYRGDLDRLDDDLKALTAQGLVDSRTLNSDQRGHGMRVLALTEAGRDLLEDHRTASFSRDRDREDAVHAGFRKRVDLFARSGRAIRLGRASAFAAAPLRRDRLRVRMTRWLAQTKLAGGERSLVRKRGFEPRWACAH